MLQEEFDYTVEMQAETLTRLARLNILHGKVHGAQMLSERCRGLTLVTSVFKDKDGEGGDEDEEKQGVDEGQAKSQGISLSFSLHHLVLPFCISLLLPLSLSAITLINESILMYTTPSSALKIIPTETLSPRVWRWVCVCERYLGEAMYSMIQEGGQ
jgi:hypothetical protein